MAKTALKAWTTLSKDGFKEYKKDAFLRNRLHEELQEKLVERANKEGYEIDVNKAELILEPYDMYYTLTLKIEIDC